MRHPILVRPATPVLKPSDTPGSQWEAGGIANPAVFVRDDNSILLAYRGKNDDGIAFATAPSWNGTYTRMFGGQRLFVGGSLEDPFLLQNKRGLHLIMHNIAGDNCTNCWTPKTEASIVCLCNVATCPCKEGLETGEKGEKGHTPPPQKITGLCRFRTFCALFCWFCV